MKKITLALCAILLSGFSFAQKSLKKEIENIIKDKKATVGVAVIFDGKDTLTVNNQYLYPMMSVVKFHQGLATLNYLEKNKLPLSKKYVLKSGELDSDTYSPLRDKYPTGDITMSISELLRYCIAESDNNVSNFLFSHITSPKETEEYIQGLGVADISIRTTEAKMQANHDNQYLNWTRPLAAAILFEKLRKENILSPKNEEFILKTLISTSTGANKIKGLLPANIVVGHKTGSSFRDQGLKVADNDSGFVILPNGKSYSISIFVMNSMEDDTTNARISAEISKAIFDYYSKK